MALVPNRRARDLALAGAATTAIAAGQQLATITPQIIQSIARQAAREMSRHREHKRSKPKRKQSARNAPDAANQQSVGPARNIYRTEKKALTVRGSNILTLTNDTSAGVSAFSVRLALDSTDMVNLAYLNTRLSNMRGMYRHWRLLSLKVSFVPVVADTHSGVMGWGFDADPYAALPTTISQVYNKEISVVGHIRSPTSITWKPYSARDREERYCQMASAGTPVNVRPWDSCSFGTLMGYTTNSLALASQVGYIKYDYVISFDEEI